MEKGRTTARGIVIHCYQRTVNGELLFYSVSDYLVFFTIFCIEARKYGVRVLALCLMPDHFHVSIVVENSKALSDFISSVTRKYAIQSNITCHRSGQLFARPFGSAPKYGAKKARTNFIYVGNNGVERQLCHKAEDYRWGFLKYAVSASPFSEPLVMRNASVDMKRAVRSVRSYLAKSKELNYALLQRLFRPLSRQEKEQLTDFIISSYDVINHAGAARFFDGYENMLEAMHTNTGSEYDLNEVLVGKSDAHYAVMCSILLKELPIADIHDIFLKNDDERFELYHLLQRKTDATPEQILKFLRLPYTFE